MFLIFIYKTIGGGYLGPFLIKYKNIVLGYIYIILRETFLKRKKEAGSVNPTF